MDCSTARLFLQLGPPGARDLEGPEAAELDAHLAHCATCHHLAADQDRLDRHLGRAIRDIPVPAGLQEQILLRLAAERGAHHRRWGGRVVLGGVAAAAATLLVVGLYAWFAPPTRTILAEHVLQGGNITRAASAEAANARLKMLGSFAGAPTFVNYAYLTASPALAILPGTEDWKSPVKVPQFVFTSGPRQAWVYVVPRSQFEIEALGNSDHGYQYPLDIYWPEDYPDSQYAFFIFHTGKNWNWLKVPAHD